MNGQNRGESRTMSWVITVIDALLVALCLWGCEMYFASADPQSALGERFRAVSMAVVACYVLCAMWLPPVVVRHGTRFDHILQRVLKRVTLLLLTSSAWLLLVREEVISRTYLCVFCAALFFVLLLSRAVEKALLGYFASNDDACQQILVCPHADNSIVLRYLKQMGVGNVQAIFSLDADGLPQAIYRSYSQESVAQYLAEHAGGSVIFFPQGQMDAHGRALTTQCEQQGARFCVVPNFSFVEGLALSPHRMGAGWMFFEQPLALEAWGNRFLKRTFDILLSLICLITFYPVVYLLAFIFIKLQSPGPVYVKHLRCGLNGKTLGCYKFRTTHYKQDAAVGSFPFGVLLHRLHLDELPQLFCILKGEMSFVGPRPHRLEYKDTYREVVDKLLVRCTAKPGLLAWSQVNASNGEARTPGQIEVCVKQEIAYAQQWTIFLDICILFKALGSMFSSNDTNE